jgi:hypothetical protein
VKEFERRFGLQSSDNFLSRLAEDPNVTVGLLEAGQYVTNEDRIDIPGVLDTLHIKFVMSF